MTSTQKAAMDPSGDTGQQNRSDHYLQLALSQLQLNKPFVIAIGGLSGSGKSSVARAVAPQLGSPCGALHLNSDIQRKRTAGISISASLPEESYTAQSSKDTYLAVLERCGHLINAHQGVIVDATFLQADHQRILEETINSYEIPFTGIWLEADPDILRSRIAGRQNDVSDADVEVLERQLSGDIAMQNSQSWKVVNAEGTLDEVAARTLEVIRTQLNSAGPVVPAL